MDFTFIFAYIVCALFTSVVSVDYFNIHSRTKRRFKVFSCLPCFTFWTSIIIFIPFFGIDFNFVFLPMLNFLIAVQWNKR